MVKEVLRPCIDTGQYLHRTPCRDLPALRPAGQGGCALQGNGIADCGTPGGYLSDAIHDTLPGVPGVAGVSGDVRLQGPVPPGDAHESRLGTGAAGPGPGAEPG